MTVCFGLLVPQAPYLPVWLLVCLVLTDQLDLQLVLQLVFQPTSQLVVQLVFQLAARPVFQLEFQPGFQLVSLSVLYPLLCNRSSIPY